LNFAFSGLFAFMGVANLVAAHYLSCDAWVNFKFYGLTGIMFVFFIGLSVAISKHVDIDKDAA
jgi:intracellular septation protein